MRVFLLSTGSEIRRKTNYGTTNTEDTNNAHEAQDQTYLDEKIAIPEVAGVSIWPESFLSS